MAKSLISVIECVDFLERYIENALVLEGSSFVRSMMNDSQRITTTLDHRGMTHALEGVDDEMRRALVVTLRMLQQKNDDSSLLSLNVALQGIRHQGLITIERWQHWSEDIRNFNLSLEEPAEHGVCVSLEDSEVGEMSLAKMSRRELLNMVVYGDIAHSERHHRVRVQAWKRAGLYPYIIFEFNEITWHCVQSARTIRRRDVEPILADLRPHLMRPK